MVIRELSAAQCTAVISANRRARLACAIDNQPYVVPIFYAYGDGCAYAFTMPGRKLTTMRVNPAVALLVEEKGEGRGWTSVLAEGRFEELPDEIGHKRQREHAWTLLSEYAAWWEPGALRPVTKRNAEPYDYVFYRIHLDRRTGRQAFDDQV